MEDGAVVPVTSTTDWARVMAMTEEEIEANALSDPDNPPISDEELARMRRSVNPRAIRRRLNLTQEQFAERFQIPVGTLRDWEQERKEPERTAKLLLRIISCHPDAVDDSLRGWSAAD
ncbi:MAG: helix-turn-helix domain-containing protein [Chloroflexota bacterium]